MERILTKMSIDLIHGDCLEVMPELDCKVDLVLADPPYGVTSCKWDLCLPFENIWPELWRLNHGVCCLFGTEPFSSALRMSQIKKFKYDWYWYKNTQTGISLAKTQPMRSIEIISVFGNSKFFPQKMLARHGRKPTQKNGRGATKSEHNLYANKGCYLNEFVNPRNVLEYKVVARSKGTFHPTQKPVPLLEYLVKTYTNEGGTVLDFCMGSGSTGVACQNTGRNFIGIEKDKKYYDIACERMAFKG